MMSRKACRSIADLPAAIDRMERDLRHYDAMSGHHYLEELKILPLIQLFPESDARHLRMKFGSVNYQQYRDEVLAFSNEERIAENHRGSKAMDVDGLTDAGSKTYTDEEWEDYAAQIHQPATSLLDIEDANLNFSINNVSFGRSTASY